MHPNRSTTPIRCPRCGLRLDGHGEASLLARQCASVIGREWLPLDRLARLLDLDAHTLPGAA